MRELLYTILELEEWCSSDAICSFCTTLYSDDDIAVCQIRTRSRLTDKIIANSYACESCKEKFENNELPKCDKCGRLEVKSRIFGGKYVCECIEYKEDVQKEELPVLSPERRQTAFYERQINALREEKNQLTEEVETHLEALEISEVWNKRQKQELLDKTKKLEEEVKQLREENKQLKSQIEIKR